MKPYFVLDVETDGPAPGLYSMVSFAVVAVWDLDISFKGQTAPITDQFREDALAISEIDRATHEAYPSPEQTMRDFVVWYEGLALTQRGVIWSDNPAFDWSFLNYYLHLYTEGNPFGFSARRIGDLYAGFSRNIHNASKWKKLRQTPHTHDPLDDAIGNAEALREIARRMES